MREGRNNALEDRLVQVRVVGIPVLLSQAAVGARRRATQHTDDLDTVLLQLRDFWPHLVVVGIGRRVVIECHRVANLIEVKVVRREIEMGNEPDERQGRHVVPRVVLGLVVHGDTGGVRHAEGTVRRSELRRAIVGSPYIRSKDPKPCLGEKQGKVRTEACGRDAQRGRGIEESQGATAPKYTIARPLRGFSGGSRTTE